MADYESNTIKPVQSLDTIAGLAPSRAREERKRRQQFHEEQEQEPPAEGDEFLTHEQPKNENNRNDDGIDYCA